MKLVIGLRVAVVLALSSVCSAMAQDLTASYKDLTQSPGGFVARTPAEHRAKLIADTIVKNGFSFGIALAMPDDPGQRQGFLTDIQGSASPEAVRAYLDQVVPVYVTALTLINKGATAAADDEIARFAAAVVKMRAAAVKVSYDNPDPDGAELNVEHIKPVTDTKAKHVVSDLSKLALGSGTSLNDVGPAQYDAELRKVLDARLHKLTLQSGVTTPQDKQKLAEKLVPLIKQEINGALWQYRELNALLVQGMDHPDQTAMDVFNTVLDELQHILKQEAKLL